MVAWLENQKIREYPEDERGGICGGRLLLRQCCQLAAENLCGCLSGPDVSIGAWEGHLSKYLEELGIG